MILVLQISSILIISHPQISSLIHQYHQISSNIQKISCSDLLRAGVAERACFWDLSRRQIELRRMPSDVLRHAAKGIDARLQVLGCYV